jgi:hypothetical protein
MTLLCMTAARSIHSNVQAHYLKSNNGYDQQIPLYPKQQAHKDSSIRLLMCCTLARHRSPKDTHSDD